MSYKSKQTILFIRRDALEKCRQGAAGRINSRLLLQLTAEQTDAILDAVFNTEEI